MSNAYRYDRGGRANYERLDNGFLRCDANLTRVGIFTYLNSDGTKRRELRLPDEVFKQDSVQSFELVPLTLGHPKSRLNAKTAKSVQVGSVASPRKDGQFLTARVMVTDEDAVLSIDNGMQELSCGYYCDLEETPGVTSNILGVPDGLEYDAIQRNIRGDHVALVAKGRAGPEARLKLDSMDAIMVDDGKHELKHVDGQAEDLVTTTKGDIMEKIKLDGVDYEVSEQAAQAVAKILERADEAIAKAKKIAKEVEAVKARADKAEEDLEAEKAAREDAESPERVRKLVADRLGLEREAAKVLGTSRSDELPGMDGIEIKKAVILSVSPKAADRLDGASEDYISARYDQAIEGFEPAKAGAEVLGAVAAQAAKPGEQRSDAKSAREAMIARMQEQGRAALGGN